jgi:uncharacterized protein (TIRG00374 family)
MRYWRLIVAVAALTILVMYVGHGEFVRVLLRTRPTWLLLYLVGLGALPLLYGCQIWVSLRLLGHDLPVSSALSGSVNAWAVGQITPARAGDLSLAHFLGAKAPAPVVVSLVVVDKALSLALLAFIAAVAGVTLEFSLATSVIIASAILLGVLGIGSVLFLAILRIPRAWRLLPQFARRFSEQARQALLAVTARWSLIAWNLVAILLKWTVVFTLIWVLFRSLDYYPHVRFVTAASAIGRLLALVPVTVGGIGLKEPIQIVIYQLDGIPDEAVVAVSTLGASLGFLMTAFLPLLIARGFGWRSEVS